MRSASPSPRLALGALPGAAWGRARQAVPGSTMWSALLVFLLTYTIARSTVTAGWVGGIEVAPVVAIGGAALMGVLAVLPLRWWIGVPIGLVAGAVVAGLVAGPALHTAHPLDAQGLPLIGIWWGRVRDGSAFTDSASVLFLIVLLMWATGAWLSWCVLRWRQPLVGLIPGAAAFATNVLNWPADQNGYTLTFLVLTLALLLWSNYTGSIASATQANVKLTGDARWDFWESGLVAMAALIVLAIMLPPLSTVDRTVTMESSMFTSWAALQQQLNHPATLGNGSGGGGTTGFSTVVSLGGPLTKSRAIVFTYTVTGDYPGPRYFRGVNVTQTVNGEWRYPSAIDVREHIPKGQPPVYGENYQQLALATFSVRMLQPPLGNLDVLFYPGQDYRIDRETVAWEGQAPDSSATTPLVTIDKLTSLSPPLSTGAYSITTEYPNVSESDLRGAGNGYPSWLLPYLSPPDGTYRSPQVLERIHQLALQVTAGATNPYDQAKAIEEYLRNPNNFTYTLNPPSAPDRTDRLEYFLFTSKQGYCEYFATAMGDMLRSLGIPTRLVNGYGPGSYDTTINSYVVRGEDAHTWVEVYFPKYGWIPFEPTNDNVYATIPRGASGSALCLRDNNCTDPSSTTGALPGSVSGATPRTGSRNDPAVGIGGGGLRVSGITLDANLLTKVAAFVVAIVLLLLAIAARYLRPRSVMAVWKRMLALARLAGAERRTGETPLELGRRLQRTFPEAAEPVGALARGFVVAAYAPPDEASSSRVSVMEAWTTLRPLLLRRVFGRFRPTRL
jgi:transglutaminase-like putative cysteine protease